MQSDSQVKNTQRHVAGKGLINGIDKRTMPMGTMAMIGTPYGSDMGISPGIMPWKPGSRGGGCACGGGALGAGPMASGGGGGAG